jgi:hypothetical protein
MPGEAHHVLRFPHLEWARKEEDWTLLAVLVEMLRGMGRTLDRYGGLFPWLEEAVAERLDSVLRELARGLLAAQTASVARLRRSAGKTTSLPSWWCAFDSLARSPGQRPFPQVRSGIRSRFGCSTRRWPPVPGPSANRALTSLARPSRCRCSGHAELGRVGGGDSGAPR